MVFRKQMWGKWIGAWDLNTVDSQQAILALKIRVLQVTSFKIWIQRGLLAYICLNWHTHNQTRKHKHTHTALYNLDETAHLKTWIFPAK